MTSQLHSYLLSEDGDSGVVGPGEDVDDEDSWSSPSVVGLPPSGLSSLFFRLASKKAINLCLEGNYRLKKQTLGVQKDYLYIKTKNRRRNMRPLNLLLQVRTLTSTVLVVLITRGSYL